MAYDLQVYGDAVTTFSVNDNQCSHPNVGYAYGSWPYGTQAISKLTWSTVCTISNPYQKYCCNSIGTKAGTTIYWRIYDTLTTKSLAQISYPDGTGETDIHWITISRGSQLGTPTYLETLDKLDQWSSAQYIPNSRNKLNL